MPQLHKSRNPGLWLPRRQPQRSVVIDWSHSLANGLMFAYVPSLGLRDLCGSGSNLTINPGASLPVKAGGVALTGQATNAGAFGSPSASQKPSATPSVFWLGAGTANPTNNVALIGCSHNNSDASPYSSYSLYSSNTGKIAFGSNINGSSYVEASSAGGLWDTTTAATSYAGTISSDGNFIVYKNGIQNASSNFAVGTIQYSATAQLEFCVSNAVSSRVLNGYAFAGYAWNRELSAVDVAYMHNNPYCFLIPEG